MNNVLYYLNLLHTKLQNLSIPSIQNINSQIDSIATDCVNMALYTNSIVTNTGNIKTSTDSVKSSTDAITTKLNTIFGNTAIDVGIGAIGTHTNRVTIATDDSSIMTGYDYRWSQYYLSTLSLSYTPWLTKFRPVTAYLRCTWWPGTGNGSTTLGSGGTQGTTGVPPTFSNTGMINSTASGSEVMWVQYPYNQVNYSLPYDGMSISMIGANDSSSGTNARTIRLKYYDNTNTLQSVSHSLGSATTYNVRELIDMYTETYGTIPYNQSTIYMYNSAASSYVACIDPNFQVAQYTHIIIPYNGFVMLDSLICSADRNFMVRLLLWKQTSATSYSYTNVTTKFFQSNTSQYKFDLSYIPKIDGPTSLTENWGIVITASVINNAANSWCHMELVGKVYRP